jgi:hypothetical protein
MDVRVTSAKNKGAIHNSRNVSVKGEKAMYWNNNSYGRPGVRKRAILEKRRAGVKRAILI